MPGGRPRIPSALKILRGNPGRRPLNDREPDVTPVTELPKRPPFLRRMRIASTFWNLKCSQLIDARILTPLDYEALARWCYWQEILIRTSKKLKYDQLGTFSSTNLLNTMSMASKQIRSLENSFGLTPESRSRVKVTNPKQKSLFDGFLDGENDADQGAGDAAAGIPQ